MISKYQYKNNSSLTLLYFFTVAYKLFIKIPQILSSFNAIFTYPSNPYYVPQLFLTIKYSY